MTRRKKYLLFIILLPLFYCGKEQATQSNELYFRLSGRNLQNWETMLGDSLFFDNDENTVSLADIQTTHFYQYSLLAANINRRGIMAHNITRKVVADIKALQITHQAGFILNLATTPSLTNKKDNGAAVEFSLVVDDGSTSHKEYGVVLRWIIDPWSNDYGQVQVWQDSIWVHAATLTPDSLDHTVSITMDRVTKNGHVRIDNKTIANAYSETQKTELPAGIYAILRFGIINAWPADEDLNLAAAVRFKNWKWEWEL
ncbi:MAG TPA: hypothetical protein PLP19_15155 [bacterium]|nr:hypothetical protein [bacterium]HPN44829.1 hypothetical protein [bacterium]